MTVVETARFLKDARPLLSDRERAELVAFIGANPEAGQVIPETGGVRKLRWALPGKGKRGGARVVYYYQSERLPVFLLAAYRQERESESHAGRTQRDETARANAGGGIPAKWLGGLGWPQRPGKL